MEDPQGVASEPAGSELAAEEEPSVARTEMRPARGRTFLPDVTSVEFSHSRRGYDRDQVDQFVEKVSRIVVELEAMRSPDAVIERALADVGEETSAILRRARRAAEEIVEEANGQARQSIDAAEAEAERIEQEADQYSDRVRAEADKTLAEASAGGEHITAQAAAEAQRIRDEADDYRDRVEDHVDRLARERQALIEDLRKLADSFHRTADRALEQMPGRESSYEEATGNGGGAAESRRA